MKKVLFLSLHRPDRTPGQRFRFEQYINYMKENGFECKHSYVLNADSDKFYYKKGYYLKKAIVAFKAFFKRLWEVFFNKYDIVFVHRECFMLGTTLFERLFSLRSKIVFDFDDSIWMRQSRDSKSGNKVFYFLKGKSKIRKLIALSDMVFAGNQYLADYALLHNKNVYIVPTTIDTEVYTKAEVRGKNNNKVCIGWSGSFSTITFFEYALPALREIKKRFEDKVYFKVIGDGEYSCPDLDIKGIPWRSETEIYDLSELDVGIMPLSDDEWTKGKCGLKGLQYMALNIPTIMSPVGVNTEIIIDGENGFLAKTDAEWISKLVLLIDSAELRKKMGEKGRKTVEEKYSVIANRNLYLQYLGRLTTS